MKRNILLRKTRLTEAVKIASLDTMDETEFSSTIDTILDHIDSVEKVHYSSDIEARVNKINNDMNDPLKQNELSQEDALNRSEERRKQQRKAEKEKYKKVGGYASLQAFKDSLASAIRLQVDFEEDEEDTWSTPNRHFENDPLIIAPGSRIADIQTEIPIVDVYFDQSPSWDAKDLEVGDDAISCLVQMEEEGLIELHIYYFATSLSENRSDVAGEPGTGAWPLILDNIKATGAHNVVVMTDDDMDEQPRWLRGYSDPPNALPTVVVEGGVWWLWRNGMAGKYIVKELRGKLQPGGCEQFSFSR